MVKNIRTEHFESILLPNIENEDILNIYLFYRKNDFVENKEFEKYLDGLDLRTMIYKLFEIVPYIEDFSFINEEGKKDYYHLNNLQKAILKFDYNNFNKKEQQELKWLLYDCKNSNGNQINSEIKEEYMNSNSNLYVYFTDIELKKKIESEIKNKMTLGFYENENKSTKIRYLKLIYNKDYKLHNKFHEFVLSKGNCKKYQKKSTEIIDHIQKPPIYYYDFNTWSNINNIMNSELPIKDNTKSEITNEIEYIKCIKDIIYAKIIGSWINANKLSNDIYRPQCNNCYYNLKELDKEINKKIKAKTIDRSSIIYPRRDLQDKNIFYITFYFPDSKSLKVNNRLERIVALTIKYDFKNITYEDIVTDLYNNIFDNNRELSIDENLNYNKLFEYIKGKEILYMKENPMSINQMGIIKTKDFFDENNEDVEKIENYQ